MKSHEGERWRSVGFYRKMHVGWLNCVVYGRSCHHLPDNNCCVVCMVGVTAIIFAHAVANTKHKSHVCITHSCLRLKGNMNLTNRPTSAKEKNKNVIELPDPIMFFGDCRNVNMNGTHCDTATLRDRKWRWRHCQKHSLLFVCSWPFAVRNAGEEGWPPIDLVKHEFIPGPTHSTNISHQQFRNFSIRNMALRERALTDFMQTNRSSGWPTSDNKFFGRYSKNESHSRFSINWIGQIIKYLNEAERKTIGKCK